MEKDFSCPQGCPDGTVHQDGAIRCKKCEAVAVMTRQVAPIKIPNVIRRPRFARRAR